MIAMTAAMMISARVCIDGTHWPIVMMKNIPTTVPRAICQERKTQPSRAKMTMMTSG